jgi:calmodulin-regulated spectrin-associated protein
MHSSVKLNMECLLADLFTLLETQPARCVQLPGLVKDRIIEVPDPETRLKSPPPQQRPGSGHAQQQQRADSRAGGGDHSSLEDGGGGGFVVQRGRTIPTLHSVAAGGGHQSHRSLSPGSEVGGTKERLNQDTKSEERGETDTPPPFSSTLNRSNSLLEQMRNIQAAGRPSSRAETSPAVKSYAGRRSRRNSTDDNQSQISLENIGGSMENISVLGRNPDKEMRVHSGKRSEIMAAAPAHLRRGSANQQTFDIRTLGGGGGDSGSGGPDNDARMFLDNRELDAMEKMEKERRAGSRADLYSAPASTNAEEAAVAGGGGGVRETKTSFADLRRKSQTQNQFASSGIHINYSSGEPDRDDAGRSVLARRDRDTSSGASPGSWEPQSAAAKNTANQNGGEDALMMNDKFNSVKAKLEERRKRIEEEIRRSKVGEGGGGGTASRSQSALNSGWLSERHRPDAATSPPSSTVPPARGVRASMSGSSNVEPYLVDHLQEMQSNLQKLAAQQSQIQQMMQNTSPPSHQQQQPPYGGHPMDPQQLYNPDQQLSPQQQQHQTPPRRTWGQPQPINFGHQGPGMGLYDRQGWGQPGPPLYGGGGGGPSHPGAFPPLPQYDQYGNPLVRDQWNSPGANQPLYSNNGPGFDAYNYGPQPYRPSQYGMQQQQPPTYQPYGLHQQPTYGSPYGGSPGPGYGGSQAAPPRMTPFRLHDSPSGGYLGGNRSYMHESEPNLSTVGLATASTPKLTGFSRSSSREQLTAALLSPGRQTSPPPPPVRRLHAPVPAPAADDMAPQNISFIDQSTDDNDDDGDGKLMLSSSGPSARSDSNLSERLARLNISRGDKTYRVQLHADGREPTALSPEPRSRPTISSTFKERRRGSNEGGVAGSGGNSGPASMSGPGSLPSTAVQTKLTEEEIETLNNMKTEVLRETGDPSKGFVISFEDDTPVRPKPVLKERRLSSNKKNSREEKLSSDPVMIMLDMNEDVDSDNRDSSPLRRKISPLRMNGVNSSGGGGGESERRGSQHRYIDSSQWNSYGSDDMKSPDDPVIPRFDIDPDVPLEPMIPLNSSHNHHQQAGVYKFY